MQFSAITEDVLNHSAELGGGEGGLWHEVLEHFPGPQCHQLEEYSTWQNKRFKTDSTKGFALKAFQKNLHSNCRFILACLYRECWGWGGGSGMEGCLLVGVDLCEKAAILFSSLHSQDGDTWESCLWIVSVSAGHPIPVTCRTAFPPGLNQTQVKYLRAAWHKELEKTKTFFPRPSPCHNRYIISYTI